MSNENKSNITKLDLLMSAIYLPILIETAIAKKIITYGEVDTEAKTLHPINLDVQRSIPLNVGRRLNALRELFNEGDMPDLSSLVVSKATMKAGKAYHLDAVTERTKVYEYDWSGHQISIQAALAEKTVTVKSVPPKKKTAKIPKNPAAMTRETALKINLEFWRINKALFPVWMRNKREDIISLLLEGHAVEDCYKKVLEKGEKQKQPKKGMSF